MLKPNKYTNVRISVLAITADLLKLFQRNRSYTYTDLLNKVTHKKGVEAKRVFLPALNFLFLLGRIEYQQEGDIIKYTHED